MPQSSEASIPDLIEKINRSGNHYETLGVEKESDEKVLKKAYRKLALQLHPDKCDAEGAEEAFKKISNAYATLSNSENRAHYDRFGSDVPAGGGGFPAGGFNGQDPAEFFQEFMSQNPDFAAAWAAGAGDGSSRPAAGINLNTFNFSAATLAGGSAYWERQAEKIPYGVLRVPFRFLGWCIFALLRIFLQTMPYSGGAAGLLAVFFGAMFLGWIINRGIWLLAFGKLPIRPRFWFGIQIAILLSGEYLGFVWDFPRGTFLYVILSVMEHFLWRNDSRQQGSTFTFSTFQGSPHFMHVGSMEGNGGIGDNVGATRRRGVRTQR